ncbi:MAG TPA: farnesyl diphosphate synthase [Desulfurivibrionaceae bacterium]|nr:farnesyl diphosphate synthase [Desulfurivibrionaceae bacterium]
MDLKQYLNDKRLQVEAAMEQLFPVADTPQPDLARHLEAMRYSLFAGGKRVRPILCLAACEAVDGDSRAALPAAVALECIHTYSLIHDDLPAMDDDALRRGRPTNHMVYGEANAILAGDGLLTWAFEILSDPAELGIPAEVRLRAIKVIAAGAGPLGMVGGQIIDIASEGKTIDFATLREIHRRKTGALILAAVQAGALIGNASPGQYAALSHYGEMIGLSFQIVDDLLNVEGNSAELGKAVGSDAERGKATYPAFFGVEATRAKAAETVQAAVDSLVDFGPKAEPLRQLALYIKDRKK